MPMINESPLTMECKVEDVYECNSFDNFICSVMGTYVPDEILDKGGKDRLSTTSSRIVRAPHVSLSAYRGWRLHDVLRLARNLNK